MNINLKSMSAFNRLDQPKSNSSVYLKKQPVVKQKYDKFMPKHKQYMKL